MKKFLPVLLPVLALLLCALAPAGQTRPQDRRQSLREKRLIMKKSQIHLEKATEDNVEDIVSLRIAKDQKGYVARNDRSLTDAYLAPAERKRLSGSS